MFKERRDRVCKRMQSSHTSQLLINDIQSIYYLTGIDNDPGERLYALLLDADGRAIMFMNRLFPVPDTDLEVIWFTDSDDYMHILSDHIDPEGTLGVDKLLPAKFLLPIMDRWSNLKVVVGSRCVDDTRAIKDEKEIELMIENSLINDEVMRRAQAHIKEGITEIEMKEYIEAQYKDLGCESLSFPVICSFGPNGADPHHMPDETVLKRGDSIVIDIGGRKDRYCSDMTRTFFCKEVSKKHAEIHDLVRRANEAAEAIIKPGVRLCDIDTAARSMIDQAGYGKEFNHRLGHFIGQTDHEFGDVSSINTDTAKPGMIFSIEPGVYIVGDFGVRVEDLVLVTEDGCKVLNHVDKKYKLIG